MKLSDDQNTVTTLDGVEHTAIEYDSNTPCFHCDFHGGTLSTCFEIPCVSSDRKDGRSVIFVTKP